MSIKTVRLLENKKESVFAKVDQKFFEILKKMSESNLVCKSK